MSFFKSQADLHAWLNEKRGERKVRHRVLWLIVGYTSDGRLWDFKRGAEWRSSFGHENWEPVPDPVPWYERPEAEGALVKNNSGYKFFWKERMSQIITEEYVPLTPDEVRELLAKAEALAE